MVGDFMVCVDRIIASACFEASGAGGEGGAQVAEEVGDENKSRNSSEKNKRNSGKSTSKNKSKSKVGGEVVECRICQEEGDDSDMEAPCACSGTLKFAHRKCIQRWCNKKGSITCEICNQIYAPNYSIPPPVRTCSDMLAIDIRQSWGPRVGDRDSHFLAIAVAEQELLQAEYEEYASSSSSVACCRTVALILMLLLLVRHMLLITRDISALQDVSALFNASLQFAGFFLPCYVIARSCYIVQSRRRRQASWSS
ncbi:RING/FYVE/PHD zinc finger superfamily protein [Rhynchospora pubera]|uniref:RING/FYVE/PHD zinc finger superfamily protein n=1 Tax=Rhynchospora pubera TaxID=906938 RepID=A0AAV8AG67_9POAL|nr:RING/FYVE/PHD zinc finger superfamily protein [Rhynchospora pubera]KAJ4757968.1 RING/FYVE/PHD zinc finger superfamily protein [Rhynchospora pubera]